MTRSSMPGWRRILLSLLPALLLSCVPPGSGSGPGGRFGGGGEGGGGIYLTASGAASVVPASIDRAASATRQAFDQLKIREATPAGGQGSDPEERLVIDGSAGDRDVSVTLEFEGTRSTRVQVVARRSSADWDKDFARTVLGKIVANTR